MQFQLNKAPVCGLLLSLCSLHVFAYDLDAQPNTLGGAIGAVLGGYIHRAIAPTNNNSMSSPQSDTTSSSQLQPIQAAPMSPEDQAYFVKGLWRDPNTGLIWSLCRVGETWNGNSCDGTPTKFDWPHAMFAARDSRLASNSDWRVPSMSEYVGIIRCPTGFDDPMYGNPLYEMANDSSDLHVLACRLDGSSGQRAFHTLPDHFKFERGSENSMGSFEEWSSSYALNSDKSKYFPKAYLQFNDSPTTPYYVRLVRGGSSGNSYQQALQLASYVLKLPMLRAKAAQDQQNDLARHTEHLRQNVKVGDQTAQGLVIEVKGSLVKVQTYKKICNMMSTTAYPFCVRYQTVVGDEEWFNRNQLNPVQ